MAEHKIIIEIDENGEIMAETLGIKGEACMDELEGILDSCSSLKVVRKTDEFHQINAVKINTIIQNKNK